MNLKLERLGSNLRRTVGVLRINGQFCCFTLEDPGRTEKVAGQTRIPSGRYPVRLRTVGQWPRRFAQRYSWHGKRSIEICEVPGYSAILIHPGNSAADTRGCILPGLGVTPPERITHSRLAYCRIARHVLPALDAGANIMITVTDPIIEAQIDHRIDEKGPA